MPFVGTGHIWIIGIVLIIVLIVWGPGKLPDVGSGMGRAIREFRKASSETKAEFARASPEADEAAAPAPAAPDVPASPMAAAVAPPDAEPVAVGAASAVDRVAVEGDRSAPN